MIISRKASYVPIVLTLGGLAGFATLGVRDVDRFDAKMKADNASFNASMKAANDSFNAWQSGFDQQLYETDISLIGLNQSSLNLATQNLSFDRAGDDASSIAADIQSITNMKQEYFEAIQMAQRDAKEGCVAFSDPTQTVGINTAAIKAAQRELCVDGLKQIDAARAQYKAYQWPAAVPQ